MLKSHVTGFITVCEAVHWFWLDFLKFLSGQTWLLAIKREVPAGAMSLETCNANDINRGAQHVSDTFNGLKVIFLQFYLGYIRSFDSAFFIQHANFTFYNLINFIFLISIIMSCSVLYQSHSKNKQHLTWM